MKRVLVPFLSIAVLALAGLPANVLADTVPVDQAALAPLASQGGPPPPPPGGGGNGGPRPFVLVSKSCASSAGMAPAPGQTDYCTIQMQGSLGPNSRLTITRVAPAGSVVMGCPGASSTGNNQCTWTFPNGTSGFSGSESFMVSTAASAGQLVRQSATYCVGQSCWTDTVAVSGAGAVVGAGGGPPPPPPFVTKSCTGPNSDGTVYAGQQDTCVVSAAATDTFRAGNRITVTPASPFGTTVAACSGVAGITTATVDPGGGVAINPAGTSCTYTVVAGATVNPGQPLGSEVINIPPTATAGAPIEQGVRWCSGGPEGICNAVPAQIVAGGPGGTVSTDPPVTATGTAVTATEGQSFTGVVATFSDADPTASPAEYSATIAWGDGTSSPGTIAGWSVSGTHTYLEEGTYAVTVTINDPDTAYNTQRAFSSATVADAALASQGTTINSTNPFSGTVATFTDADPNGTVTEYTALIDWGDGTATPGTVAQDGSHFDVNGTHAYAELGPHTVTVHVCDDGGACTDTTSSIMVYALTTGGNFVIGDGNAALGSSVTFWGAQWATSNTVSGGAAPADFKGFADDPNAAPACGSMWSTRPGNSSNPPADVPTYTAVIVTNSVQKDKGRLSGTTTEVVIVRTDPGYAPNPGHAGTGTVVAVLCP